MSSPSIGVTLFSFTRDYRKHRYTFEELIRKVSERNLGGALEIVGFQSLRDYPNVSDETARRFRRLLDEVGLRPSALSGNIDAARLGARMMTHDETVEVIEAQIESARKLGYPVLKVQFGASADALEAALPKAERANVKLAVEVHSPHHVRHPTMLALRERFEKLESGFLGFVPDFGASMNAIPRSFLDHWRRQPDAPSELIDFTVGAWGRAHSGEADAFVEREQVLKKAIEMNAQTTVRLAWSAMTLYGHQRPADWLEIMPLVFHVHAKFYEIDDAGNEPSIAYDELVRTFRDGGYQGVLSSEWEGAAFLPDADALEMVERQQSLVSRILAS